MEVKSFQKLLLRREVINDWETKKHFFEFAINVSVTDQETGACEMVIVNIKKETEPRESYFIKGWVVHGGWANTEKMIENTINKLSYEVYKVLVKMKAQENQQES